MPTRSLPHTDWSNYFDTFSRNLIRDRRTDYAEIRIMSDDIGVHRETAWLPLQGITYDARSDALEILVENLDHLVLHPREIFVDEDRRGITAIEIIDREGVREIVEVR